MKRLRELLEEGLASRPPTDLTEWDVAAIRKRISAAGRAGGESRAAASTSQDVLRLLGERQDFAAILRDDNG